MKIKGKRYICISIINTLFSYIIFLLLHHLGVRNFLSLLIVYALCPYFNHFMYSRYVFKKISKRVNHYSLTYFFVYVLNLVFLSSVESYIGSDIAQLISIIIIGVGSIIYNNYFFNQPFTKKIRHEK